MTQVGFAVEANFRIRPGVWEIVRTQGAVFNHEGDNLWEQVKVFLVENAASLAKKHYSRCEAVRLIANLSHGNTEYGNKRGEFGIKIEYFVERGTLEW